MSSILKALRKLDQEKSSRPGRDADIAAAILRGERSPARSKWLVPAGMAAVAAAAVLATYMVMSLRYSQQAGQVEIPDQTRKNITAAAPSAPRSAPATAAPSEGSQKAASPPSTMGAPPARFDSSPSIRAASKKQLKDASVATRTESPHPVARQAENNEKPRPAKPAAAETTSRSNTATGAIPALRISGIAWEKDTASRLAVINGQAVSQGAVIEGAKVEEITPDRVRFSIGRTTFEIPLGKIQN